MKQWKITDLIHEINRVKTVNAHKIEIIGIDGNTVATYSTEYLADAETLIRVFQFAEVGEYYYLNKKQVNALAITVNATGA